MAMLLALCMLLGMAALAEGGEPTATNEGGTYKVEAGAVSNSEPNNGATEGIRVRPYGGSDGSVKVKGETVEPRPAEGTKAIEVNAESVSATNSQGTAMAVYAGYSYGDDIPETTVNVTGGVSATGAYAEGIYVDSDDNVVTVNTGDVQATGGNTAYGISMGTDSNNTVNINVGSVSASADASAIGIDAIGTAGSGRSGETNVVATGDVTATATGNNGIAIGINSEARTYGGSSGGAVSVIVKDDEEKGLNGDVTATGAYAAGVFAVGNANSDDQMLMAASASESSSGDNTIDIVIAGTLSGDSAAVAVPGQAVYRYAGDSGLQAATTQEESYTYTYDAPNLSLTVWKAVENAARQIVCVVEVETTIGPEENQSYEMRVLETDEAKALAEKMEKEIHYIIKKSKGEGNAVNTAKGEKDVQKENYDTANEGETVSVTLTGYSDGDELEVYYNDDTKLELGEELSDATYTIADGLVKVMMRRGGEMNLLARVLKKAETEEKPEEKTEEKKSSRKSTATETTAAKKRVGMIEALIALGDKLAGEDVSVVITDADKLVDEALMAKFNALSVKERLLVVCSLLGCGTADELSDEALALIDEVDGLVGNLSDEDRQARQDQIDESFRRRVTVDGEERDSVRLEVEITKGEETTTENHTFYEDEDGWKEL